MQVPDDASELEPDRRAWLAEERGRRRRARARRLVLTRRWERFGLSGPLVVVCLLATALVGALAVVVTPRPRGPAPSAAPLATVPVLAVPDRADASPPPGTEPSVGGLLGRRLPPARLEGDVRAVVAADLRPAVLVLVPAACDCPEAVGGVYRQAREFRLPVWLLGSGSRSGGAVPADLVRLDEAAAAGAARWAVDRERVLFRALNPRGITVALVSAEGVLAALRRDVPRDPDRVPALEPVLARLADRR